MRFKALALALVSAAGISSAAQAGIANVLIYEDFTLGTSAYIEAVTQQGWNFTLTANPVEFASLLATGSGDQWTHVISAHQNTFGAAGFEGALSAWALDPDHAGRPLLISDWRVNGPQPYLATLGFAYGGSTNLTGTFGVPDQKLDGQGGSLASPGWGIFSYDVTGGTIEATSSPGGAGLGMVAHNGSWWFNGFLSDTFAISQEGVDLVIAELKWEPIPAPGAMALLGLAGIATTRRRRR